MWLSASRPPVDCHGGCAALPVLLRRRRVLCICVRVQVGVSLPDEFNVVFGGGRGVRVEGREMTRKAEERRREGGRKRRRSGFQGESGFPSDLKKRAAWGGWQPKLWTSNSAAA